MTSGGAELKRSKFRWRKSGGGKKKKKTLTVGNVKMKDAIVEQVE